MQNPDCRESEHVWRDPASLYRWRNELVPRAISALARHRVAVPRALCRRLCRCGNGRIAFAPHAPLMISTTISYQKVRPSTKIVSSVNLLMGTGELPASPASLFAARSFRTLKLVEEPPSASMTTASASSVTVEKPHASSAKAASTAEARASSVPAAVGKKVRRRFTLRAYAPVKFSLLY